MNEQEQTNGVAIPLVVWKFLIGLFVFALFLCFVGVVYYHHSTWQDFMGSGLDVFFTLLKVVAALAIVAALVLIYRAFHITTMHHHERKSAKYQVRKVALQVQKAELQIEMLRAKTEAVKQHPQIITAALQYGFNIEHEGLKISSSQHVLSAVEATKGYLSPGQVVKPSIDELVSAVKPNNFEVAIGKSLTTQEVITVELPDKHIKVIGATRMGKSCMIASIIEQLRQTHDRQHLLLAILDLEDMTGRLFEDDPHILKIQTGEGTTKIHARNVEQVASYIIMLHSLMLYRYEQVTKFGIQFMDTQPRVLIYFEEFLYWKRLLAQFVPDEDIRRAAIGAVTGIATRGLKVGMHLAVSAQVDYADKDFLEAMAQFVGINVSFAVKPSSARAAGFVSTELLNRNFEARSPGQYVVEMIGGSDMGIAPDYDVKALVKALPHAIQGPLSEGDLPRGPVVESDSSKETPIFPKSQDDEDLQKVVDAWKEGSTSIMKVMAITGLGQNKTRVLITKAKTQGLIEE